MPSHPIASGIDPAVVIPEEEMFCEYFDIPIPDEVVFISTFKGGEVFRSGCCFTRGKGRIFYFRPGHESFPTYHHPQVQQILANAARWACNDGSRVNLASRDALDLEEFAKQFLKTEGWFLPSPVSAKSNA
jgi:trehalose utilization protein